MTLDANTPTADGANLGALWAANLLGPAIVLMAQEAAYMLSELGCRADRFWPMHLSFAIGLAVTFFAGGIGWRELRRQELFPANSENRISRRRFMAITGSMLSLMSILVLFAMWSATIFLRPCQ